MTDPTPATVCDFCWPRVVEATTQDTATLKPCCQACSERQNKAAGVPKFARNSPEPRL